MSLHCAQGKLSFSYTGKGNHINDVGAVQANRPFAVNELIGYFELHITSTGHRGNIAIGLSNQDFNVTHHPGNHYSGPSSVSSTINFGIARKRIRILWISGR